MKFLADLHIHSKYSRATSRDMVLDAMAPWAKVKGISLLATGDFTHPEWLFLMKEKLEPMGNGFLRLKSATTAFDAPLFSGLPVLGRPISFVLSSELSFIYSKGGKVRKVHVMLLAPDFDRFALVSNSDAHSPSKIGREANAFDTDFSFRGLIDALRANDPAKFLYTVEFFPEEGKY